MSLLFTSDCTNHNHHHNLYTQQHHDKRRHRIINHPKTSAPPLPKKLGPASQHDTPPPLRTFEDGSHDGLVVRPRRRGGAVAREQRPHALQVPSLAGVVQCRVTGRVTVLQGRAWVRHTVVGREGEKRAGE